MDNKPIHLIDTDLDFVIVTDNLEVQIEYGRFALSLINTDYQAMNNLIRTFIQNNHILKVAEEIQSNCSNKAYISTDVTDIIFADLYKPIQDFLSTEYLSKSQATAIARLLLQEIKQNIMTGKIDLTHATDYLPPIFSNIELHNHIRDSLLLKNSAFTSDLQEQLNQTELSTSIQIMNDGTPVTVFCLEDTFSYLVVDMQKYLLSQKYVNECECCQRLFYPRYRNSEIYCRLPRKDTDKTCNQIMLHSKDDDFAKERNKARGYQHNRCNNPSTRKQYDLDFLIQIYDNWSTECADKVREYRLQGDFDGFKDWCDNTKFTSERLKELYQQYTKK